MELDLKCEFLNSEEDHYKKVMEFRCSDREEVESFLKRDSWRLHMYGHALTRLYFDKDRNLIGFLTLFADSVFVSNTKLRKLKVKPSSDFTLYPSIRIHYLGVDDKYRKHGFGTYILLEAFKVSAKTALEIGATFISVEALGDSETFYRKFQFVSLEKKGNINTMVFRTKEIINEMMQ